MVVMGGAGAGGVKNLVKILCVTAKKFFTQEYKNRV